jgi:tRNA modification GTPase
MDNTSYTPEEPIAAIATALAPAALGIIRCSGKNCITLISKIFSRPKALLEAEGNTIVYGWIKDGEKKIDEVLASVFRAPKSFTGEDLVEINCHGGTAVINTIFQLLLRNGFRQAQRGEYTFRAFINRKTDLTKAEAVREIIESKTDDSRTHAAGRLAGNLYTEILRIKQLVIDTLAAIEVEIEYPEDEETIADAFDSKGIKEAASSLQSLSDSWKSEKLYQDGARVVLCGRTNAGKSSLFNSLLKEERAIVSDIEGTTRDWIECFVSFDGIPARLFDTAGLRKTTDVIESKGLELTNDLSKEADVVLYIADCTAPNENKIDMDFISNCNVPVVFVWNKIDKGEGSAKVSLSLEQKAKIPTLKKEVFVSAKTGLGILELTKAVKDILIDSTATEREAAGLGSERQKVCVEEALECLKHALDVSCEDYTLDAVVQDLEDSLDSLGEITGEVTPEDVLDSVFSHFCVGK